jgi:hypothetical protein
VSMRLGKTRPPKQVLPRHYNDHTLAAGTSDVKVHRWDLTTSAQRICTAEQANCVGCLAFSPDGRRPGARGRWCRDDGNVEGQFRE